MNKLRVAIIINDLIIGGAQKMLLDLIPWLIESGIVIKVYVLYKHRENEKSFIEQFQIDGIDCCYLDCKRKSLFMPTITLYKELKKFDPDILHSHLPNSVIVSSIVGFFLGKSHIIHEHQDHSMHSWKIRLALAIARIGSEITICYTELLESALFGKISLLNSIGVPNVLPKSVTILNGVDLDKIDFVKKNTDRDIKRLQIGIDCEKVLITNVSRMIPWKGQEHLIRAFAKALKINPEMQLCLVGDGEQRAILNELVKSLHIDQDVFFLGSRNDVYEILSMSEIFCSVFQFNKNNNTVAISINGLEAMACCLPVIIGNQGNATKYISQGENGLIVEANDLDELSNAILQLASDSTLRKEIGEKARSFIQNHYSVKAISDIYASLYYKVVL